MIKTAVLPIWQTSREKFVQKVMDIPEEQLTWKLDGMTIGELIHHTADVEYMFAEWYLHQTSPAHIPQANTDDKLALIALLKASNTFIVQAIEDLPDLVWQEKVDAKMGAATPLETISRLLYHTGIHAGQITTIQKSKQ